MIESLEITILVDNQASEGLTAEHGLAIWIENAGHRILFDTGQGAALRHNSEELGVHLEEADIVVLSHGHYDHTGGLPYVVEKSSDIDVYCHPGSVISRYSIRPNHQPRAIHMPHFTESLLGKMNPERLHLVTSPTLIFPDIGITGPVPRNNDFEDTGGPFFLDAEGRLADPIDDDQALWIKTLQGLVIVVGCCHSGLVNTVDVIRQITGESKVFAVIGGFHLGAASPWRMEKTSELFRNLDVKIVVPCHCTGKPAMELFRSVLGHVVRPGHAGLRIRI